MKGVFRVFMDKKNQRPEFHGSDLEKIAAYYHIPASEIPGIIKFGANVNPLGLSESVILTRCEKVPTDIRICKK